MVSRRRQLLVSHYHPTRMKYCESLRLGRRPARPSSAATASEFSIPSESSPTRLASRPSSGRLPVRRRPSASQDHASEEGDPAPCRRIIGPDMFYHPASGYSAGPGCPRAPIIADQSQTPVNAESPALRDARYAPSSKLSGRGPEIACPPNPWRRRMPRCVRAPGMTVLPDSRAVTPGARACRSRARRGSPRRALQAAEAAHRSAGRRGQT